MSVLPLTGEIAAMSDTHLQTCATVVEVLIPGPQGPEGAGNQIGGHPILIEDVQLGHVIVFNGEAWHNQPLASGGDMMRAVYDINNDGKVDVAKFAEGAPWTGISDVPENFPPAAHLHTLAEVTGLQAAIDEKAPLVSPALAGTPTAPTAVVGTNTMQVATTAFVVDAIANIEAGQVSWDSIIGKPASFLPSAHVHDMVDVNGLTAALANKASLASPALTGTPTAPTAVVGTNTTQVATTAFVTSAIAAIPANEPVTWSAIADKPTSFAPSAHTHVIADVTGLGMALAGKADVTAIPAVATVATLLAGSDNATFATPQALALANGVVVLDAVAATVGVDLSQGLNFSLALPGNRTLANPTHMRVGQSGSIWLTRSAASATLSFDTYWKPAGNTFSISTATTDADLITFFVVAQNTIVFNVLNGFKP